MSRRPVVTSTDDPVLRPALERGLEAAYGIPVHNFLGGNLEERLSAGLLAGFEVVLEKLEVAYQALAVFQQAQPGDNTFRGGRTSAFRECERMVHGMRRQRS